MKKMTPGRTSKGRANRPSEPKASSGSEQLSRLGADASPYLQTCAHLILSCEQVGSLEEALFGGDEAREWPAMQAAGRAVAGAVLRDFEEIGGFPADGRVLVLAGKGHNGGDALLAAQQILLRYPAARTVVIFAFGQRPLRPLAARAWRELAQFAAERIAVGQVADLAGSSRSTGTLPVNIPSALGCQTSITGVSDPGYTQADASFGASNPLRVHSKQTAHRPNSPATEMNHGQDAHATSYDLCLDGVFGFQFRPPLDPATAALLAGVNALPIRLRAAVDLPSGLDAPDAFRADFTYATGVVKTPVLALPTAGRLRYLDLGFFTAPTPLTRQLLDDMFVGDRVLTAGLLAPLGGLRAAGCDKRSFGHLLVLGGSRSYPGAVLMAVRAALRSGVGLVTAFVPESLAPAFAACSPEAMWVGWPETPAGGLALEGLHLLRERLERAAALLIGPGLGREPETLALVAEVLKATDRPVLLDADALQPELVRAGNGPRVLTPHAGEFARIAGGKTLEEFSAELGATVVLKGPVTRIVGGGSAKSKAGGRSQTGPTLYSFFGGPVLARGGSGDLLAGLTGGLLAQTPEDPLLAATRGALWHGLAADRLARAHGQVAVETTQLLDFLSEVLRERAGTDDCNRPASPAAG